VPFCNTGSSTCTPCSVGSFSSIVGSVSCTSCPAGRQCLLGAAQPSATLSSEMDITAMAAIRPSITQSPLMTAQANQASASSNFRVLILGCSGGLFVLFLLVAIAAQKNDFIGRVVNCSSQMADDNALSSDVKASTALVESMWVKLDVVFSSFHYVPPGGVKEVRKTAFGGMMTVVFLVVILALSVQLAVDNLTVVFTTSIVGELPTWDPRGTYRLTVRAHGIGLAACDSNVLRFTFIAADWTGAGGSISLAWSAIGTSTSLEGGVADGSCTVMWTCTQCMLLKSSASTADIKLSAPTRAWATYLEYTFETPQLTSSATSSDAISLPVFVIQVCLGAAVHFRLF
jgi:hypothetical protein